MRTLERTTLQLSVQVLEEFFTCSDDALFLCQGTDGLSSVCVAFRGLESSQAVGLGLIASLCEPARPAIWSSDYLPT